MQIVCDNCSKKFELNESLIPDNGRMLQCGNCNNKWFYKKNFPNEKPLIINKTEKAYDNLKEKKKQKKNKKKQKKENLEIGKIENSDENLPNKKIKKIKKNYFKLFLVLIITIFSIIIFLDTFKIQISTLYPDIDLILINLYESIKDLTLFVQDLVK